jgi:hypothetical protein
MTWLDDINAKEHIKKDAMPPVAALFDIVRRDANLDRSLFCKTLRRNLAAQVKTAPKDAVIWPLKILLQYARDCQDPAELPWPELMGLAAAVFMIFLPCRPIALIRLQIAGARVRKSDGAIIVPAREKTDIGKGVTEMVFRSAREWRLSTGYYFHLLRGRARGKGVDDALFCAEDGRRYTR